MRTGTKAILFILQILSLGIEASFIPLSHNMKIVDHQSSLKHPTFHKKVICRCS